MTAGKLSTRRVEGLGEGSLVGTLAKLLQLTGEAVLVFDGTGRVLLANDEAGALFGGATPLVGADVRHVFPAEDGSEPTGSFSPGDLPFPLDGSLALAPCVGADGRLGRARVRCGAVVGTAGTHVLVALPVDDTERVEREHDRALDDLRRANHRLSGTLKIVLDTIDISDLSELFGRVLEEITDAMEADGTIVYLAGSDGFHLRGLSSGLAGERVARFMAFDRAVERLAVHEGCAVRLRVCAPLVEQLRRGRLATREVVNEETHEILTLKSDILPPFTSFMAVPVWFGGHVIAIIEVGWRRMHPLPADDARLLDSVAHYLAVQLEGAFAALRSQRAERLAALSTELREELLDASSAETGEESLLGRVWDALSAAAEELEAVPVRVRVNPHQGVSVAELPLTGTRALPGATADLVRAYERDGICVAPILPGSDLGAFLRELGEPCEGALVDLGELARERCGALLLRPYGAEPLDDLELEFLWGLLEDVRDIARGEEARERDKRISQALQTGMRNELQQVDGITAEAVYSSATKAASVGGDFYDLIRLPGRRACVIMGDVSGKGVEAASVSAAVKTALGAYAWEGLAPARMVRSLNEFLLGFSRLETFATLFVGIVDLSAGKIRYCSAGHPPAIMVRDGADEISALDVQSGVVGAFHDIAYRDGTVRIAPGDVLLLYTDGTTEARDPEGAFFGEEGLREMVMRESAADRPFEGFVGRLLEGLEAFTGRNLEDDVAMLALRFDEVGRAR